MRTSVIIATYNGERYIERQLDSILNQSERVEEVIIRDDCSTDTTVEKVQRFIDKYNLINWKLCKNKSNLGWRRNFSELISEASGDVIYLCDQDDEWLPDKTKKMNKIMSENKSIEVLVSDYDQKIINNAHGDNDDLIQEDSQNIEANVCAVDQNMKNYAVKRPGWTFAVRNSELISQFLKYRPLIKDKGHDAMIWQLSLAKGTLFHLHDVTGTWTMHKESAIATEKSNNIMLNKSLIKYLSDEVTMFDTMIELSDNSSFIDDLTEAKEYYLNRITVLSKHSVWIWLRKANSYRNFKSMIGDLKRVLIG